MKQPSTKTGDLGELKAIVKEDLKEINDGMKNEYTSYIFEDWKITILETELPTVDRQSQYPTQDQIYNTIQTLGMPTTKKLQYMDITEIIFIDEEINKTEVLAGQI